MPISPSLRSQLELAGLEESIRSAEQGATTSGQATRQRRALETASDLMSRLPERAATGVGVAVLGVASKAHCVAGGEGGAASGSADLQAALHHLRQLTSA